MAGEASDTIKQRFLDEYMALVNFPTNRVSMFTTARDTSEEAACAKNCLIALLPYCVIGSSTSMSRNCVLEKSGSSNQSVVLPVSLERNVITNKEQAYSLRVITQSGTSEFASRNKAILPSSTNKAITQSGNKAIRHFMKICGCIQAA